MAMYCFCRCFLYPRTECMMWYRAERKFYPILQESRSPITGNPRLISSLFPLSKNCLHNEVWGYAEVFSSLQRVHISLF